MKKSFNKLLIIAIISMVLTAILCFAVIVSTDFTQFAMQELEKNSDGMELDISQNAELLKNSMCDSSIVLSYVTFVVVTPTIFSLIILASQIFARLFQIGEFKNWKYVTGLVFTYLSVVAFVFMALNMLANVILCVSIMEKVFMSIACIINIITFVLFIKELIKMDKISKKSEENA